MTAAGRQRSQSALPFKYMILQRALDGDRALVRYDDREGYRDDRFIATGPVGNRLHVVTFTMRDEAMRVISIRACR